MSRRNLTASPCQYCGVEMILYPSQIGRKKFCSKACYGAAREGTHRASSSMSAFVCEYCGRTFSLLSSVARSRETVKYCSRQCMGFASRQPGKYTDLACDHCGAPFKRLTSHIQSSRHYCSLACMYEAKRREDAKWRNPEYVKAYMRQYTIAHRARHNERGRQWDLRNPEKRRRTKSKWRHANGAKIRVSRSRRRARIKAVGGTHNWNDVERLYERQKGKCYYCRKALKGIFHVDHAVPISRGGSNGPENIVIACPTCNAKKNSKMPHEWSEGGRLL